MTSHLADKCYKKHSCPIGYKNQANSIEALGTICPYMMNSFSTSANFVPQPSLYTQALTCNPFH